MNEVLVLIVFACSGLICIWWMGNIAIGLRKQNSELVDKLVQMSENRAFDREPSPQLPDYIPMECGMDGGFYKQSDGSWVASLNGDVIRPGPFGGKSTTDAVEGVYPDEVDLEEEA